MTLWGVAALVLTACFLAYKHSPMSWNSLSQWLLPESWRAADQKSNSKTPSDGQINEQPIQTDVPKLDEPEPSDGESTPKVHLVKPKDDIPTLSLSEDFKETKPKLAPPLPPQVPMFPAPTSAQRTSAMPPTSVSPKPTKNSPSSLMPPPARPSTIQRPTPASAAASLRVPSTGPLPNRGPANNKQPLSGGLAPNGAISTPNARGKVLLSPGHSPMDWAVLTRSSNLSGVSTFQRVKPSELRRMTGRKGKPAWSTWQGKVYNITPYLPFHPGGEVELMKAAARDGTKLFNDVHPWVNWENMLGSCLVGVMVPEDYGTGQGESSLEDMD